MSDSSYTIYKKPTAWFGTELLLPCSQLWEVKIKQVSAEPEIRIAQRFVWVVQPLVSVAQPLVWVAQPLVWVAQPAV